MKKVLILLLLLCCISVCVAQNEQDIQSRERADNLLSRFDSIQSSKILFSISNRHYYLAYKHKCGYKEYYLKVNENGQIKEQRQLKTTRSDRKLLDEAFDLTKYHRNFITRIDDPKANQGNSSYFVIKDKTGIRYGEYSLSVITAPIPINGEVYKHVVSKLITEVGREANKP